LNIWHEYVKVLLGVLFKSGIIRLVVFCRIESTHDRDGGDGELSLADNACAVILAAGNGKRMVSGKAKIFCEILFKPLVCWVFENCKQTAIRNICLVCSNEGLHNLKQSLGNDIQYVVQKEKLGSAHAVAQADLFLRSCGKEDVLILLGDVPFVNAETIESAYREHKADNNEVTVIAAEKDKPFGYGRIVRSSGQIIIVEETEATNEQRAIKLVNSGAMWFNIQALLSVLGKIDNNNANGEYYITTAVNLLSRVGCFIAQGHIILGVNTNEQLFELNQIVREKIIAKHSRNGVEFLSVDGVVIGPDVDIGPGSLIFPNVILKGRCRIGERVRITSGSFIEESEIGAECEIKASYIQESTVGRRVQIGPFAHLRQRCRIADDVRIGNYVEIKNSEVGAETRIAHLGYVGDCNMGKQVNFGCGSIVVNYDGKQKHQTKIEDGAFIGCNSNLVAPVTIGKGAFVAAGSTISENLGEGDFAIARARQTTKAGYMNKKKGEDRT
jgi:bifunctional UDP-N-acetylglucosamine pyrophosphorylase/glucosamine-1-phosphate N-acetyltransferase